MPLESLAYALGTLLLIVCAVAALWLVQRNRKQEILRAAQSLGLAAQEGFLFGLPVLTGDCNGVHLRATWTSGGQSRHGEFLAPVSGALSERLMISSAAFRRLAAGDERAFAELSAMKHAEGEVAARLLAQPEVANEMQGLVDLGDVSVMSGYLKLCPRVPSFKSFQIENQLESLASTATAVLRARERLST